MSYGPARVKFPDGEVWYGEYNNTCNTYCSRIYSTKEERNAKWRSGDWHRCTCKGVEPCIMEVDGDYYLMQACRNCKSLGPDYDRYSEGGWDDLSGTIICLPQRMWEEPIETAVARVDKRYEQFVNREGLYKYW